MLVDVEKSTSGTDTQWLAESGVVDLFILLGPSPQQVQKKIAPCDGDETAESGQGLYQGEQHPPSSFCKLTAAFRFICLGHAGINISRCCRSCSSIA